MVQAPIEYELVNGHKCIDAAVCAFEHDILIDVCDDSNNITASGMHIVLNRVSIWCVAVIYYGILSMLRQDGLAQWAVLGSVVNTLLSFTLKRILNQERPVSEVCSGPGMPSTHAQTISFASIFIILSVNGWLGLNGFSVILSGIIIALGLYLTWLRVLLRYHTTCQVVAGTVIFLLAIIISLFRICFTHSSMRKYEHLMYVYKE